MGVRKNGLRNRQTLDGQDLLIVPDDCLEIEIADEGFELFAKAVAELRLRYAQSVGSKVPNSLREFMQELSLSEEAIVLGADRIAENILSELDGSQHFEIGRAH